MPENDPTTDAPTTDEAELDVEEQPGGFRTDDPESVTDRDELEK